MTEEIKRMKWIELIHDRKNCDVSVFNRLEIKLLMVTLCDKIDMKREDLHFWDYQDDPESKKSDPPEIWGISAVQFIKTSNITLHALDVSARVYLNLISCKMFDPEVVGREMKKWCGGGIVNEIFVTRY